MTLSNDWTGYVGLEEELLLDLFDEDLPEELHPNLYADGELLDVYQFMEI